MSRSVDSLQILVQSGHLLRQTSTQFERRRGREEEREHLERPVLVGFLDGGEQVLLRHLQQHSKCQATQTDTSFFFFAGFFSFDFLGGGFLFDFGDGG